MADESARGDRDAGASGGGAERLWRVDDLGGDRVGFSVAIVVSAYNRWVTERLEAGAVEALERLTGGAGRAAVVEVSGSLEIPTVAAEAAMSGAFDAVVTLGCVIKGETEHDRFIAQAIIESLTETSVASGVPIGIGVLTVNNADQAEARAGGALGNKGAEAMEAALASAGALGALRRFAGRDASAGRKAGSSDG